MDYPSEQEGYRTFDIDVAKELIESSQRVDYSTLLQSADVLYLGEAHNDYSIATHLQSHVKELKQSGVRTFAVELNPEDQPILDAISEGDLSQMDRVRFSLGYGSHAVEENKRQLIKALVKHGLFAKGIHLVGVANWDKHGEPYTYTQAAEQNTADIIKEKLEEGKVAVLIGAMHAAYAEGDLRYPFLRSTDLLRRDGVRIDTAYFTGGMNQPGEYSRSEEAILRRAAERTGVSKQEFYIPSSQQNFPHRFKNYDGLIHLPHVPFRAVGT